MVHVGITCTNNKVPDLTPATQLRTLQADLCNLQMAFEQEALDTYQQRQ